MKKKTENLSLFRQTIFWFEFFYKVRVEFFYKVSCKFFFIFSEQETHKRYHDTKQKSKKATVPKQSLLKSSATKIELTIMCLLKSSETKIELSICELTIIKVACFWVKPKPELLRYTKVKVAFSVSELQLSLKTLIFCYLRGSYNLIYYLHGPKLVGSVAEWLKHRTDDQHGLGSKPTCAILLCPWERHLLLGGLDKQF